MELFENDDDVISIPARVLKSEMRPVNMTFSNSSVIVWTTSTKAVSDHGPDHGPDHGSDRGPDYGPDHGLDHGSDHGPDHGQDHGPDHGSDH